MWTRTDAQTPPRCSNLFSWRTGKTIVFSIIEAAGEGCFRTRPTLSLPREKHLHATLVTSTCAGKKERKRRRSIDLWRSFFIRHTHPLPPTAVSQFWETCLGKKRLRKCPTPTDDFCGVSRKLARTRAIIWPKIMQHVVVFMTRLILRLDRPICS